MATLEALLRNVLDDIIGVDSLMDTGFYQP
jgi:hypothetical protein